MYPIRKHRIILTLAAALCCASCATIHGQQPIASATPPPAQVVVQLPAKDNFHIYLLMGQSNMAGRGQIPSEPQPTNVRILMMTPDGKWVPAKDPLHQQIGRIEPGVGPGMSFATEMLKTDPKITIGLVPCAVGGTALERWVKKGDLYQHAVERAKAAAQVGIISGVLWHQGESDTDKQPWADSYEKRLVQMIKDLRQDLGEPNLPFVVGQLGEFLPPDKHPYLDTVRAALKHMPADLPHVGYADSSGLKDKGDQLHFNADSQRQFGIRYAEAMQEAQRK